MAKCDRAGMAGRRSRVSECGGRPLRTRALCCLARPDRVLGSSRGSVPCSHAALTGPQVCRGTPCRMTRAPYRCGPRFAACQMPRRHDDGTAVRSAPCARSPSANTRRSRKRGSVWFEELRFELVTRKLLGDELSAPEEAILGAINAALLESMPRPSPESEQVRAAVDEVKLLLARRRGG
jgi:hypothetical protein